MPLHIRLPHHDLREALRMTAYPAHIKTAHPRFTVRIEGDRLGRALFAANPHVDGIVFPKPWSSTTAFPPDSERWVPELHVSEAERQSMDRFIDDHTLEENRGKPLCVIHPWPNSPGGGIPGEAHPGVDYWDEVIRRAGRRYRFWQLGGPDDSCVQGCEFYFFLHWRDGWTARGLRRAITLIDRAQAFAGIDDAPAWMALGLTKPRAVVSVQAGSRRTIAAADELAETLLNLSFGPS